jgi:hypothetical protein
LDFLQHCMCSEWNRHLQMKDQAVPLITSILPTRACARPIRCYYWEGKIDSTRFLMTTDSFVFVFWVSRRAFFLG